MFWNHGEAQTEGGYLPEAEHAGVPTRQFTRTRSINIVQYQPGLPLHGSLLDRNAPTIGVHFDNVRG